MNTQKNIIILSNKSKYLHNLLSLHLKNRKDNE